MSPSGSPVFATVGKTEELANRDGQIYSSLGILLESAEPWRWRDCKD